MNRKGGKYQNPSQVLSSLYWIICLEEGVIPGSKARMTVWFWHCTVQRCCTNKQKGITPVP